MATYVGQNYYGGWPQELSDGDEPQEIPVSQMLDHGSISFGRFTVESLSWERKSVFAHDRRQEELEKFNGLVAKKKAYFEERYRRMRALKAAQQSQQTELILDYGGDGSNSSQSEEEDEKASKGVGPRDHGSANVTSIPSEEQAKSEALLEQESCHSGSHQAHKPNQETEEIFANVDQVKIYSGISKLEQAKMDSSSQMGENVEESEANHSNTPRSRKIMRKPENLESNSKPGTATKVSRLKRESLQVNQSQLIKKSQGHISSPKNKDSIQGTRRGPGLKQETKSDLLRLPKGITNPLRQTFGKAENSHLNRSTNVSKVNSTRSNLLASKRPLVGPRTERTNLTTPGAFSVAMEKRTNLRGSEVKQDSRIPNKLLSSLGHVKGDLSVQDASSKKTSTTTSIKNTREAENKRVSKEGQMKPPSSDNQTRFKRTEQPLIPKSRSINLPARNKSGSISALALQPTVVKETKQKKETEITRPRELQVVGTRSNIHLKAATKGASVQKAQQYHSVRRQQLDNLSLDGRKPKRDVPQWR